MGRKIKFFNACYVLVDLVKLASIRLSSFLIGKGKKIKNWYNDFVYLFKLLKLLLSGTYVL